MGRRTLQAVQQLGLVALLEQPSAAERYRRRRSELLLANTNIETGSLPKLSERGYAEKP